MYKLLSVQSEYTKLAEINKYYYVQSIHLNTATCHYLHAILLVVQHDFLQQAVVLQQLCMKRKMSSHLYYGTQITHCMLVGSNSTLCYFNTLLSKPSANNYCLIYN